MRWLRSLVCCLALSPLASAAEVELVRVWPQWNNGNAFDRIGLYFGGKENTGSETVLRTQNANTPGLYFLTRVKSERALEHVTFTIDIIRPDSPEPKTFTFNAPLPADNRVFHLGLTGSDWPGGQEAHPVAWRLTLRDASGQVLATEQSFLWAQPKA